MGWLSPRQMGVLAEPIVMVSWEGVTPWEVRKIPCLMIKRSPTFWLSCGRSIGVLGLAFLLMDGLGVMAEEQGVSRKDHSMDSSLRELENFVQWKVNGTKGNGNELWRSRNPKDLQLEAGTSKGYLPGLVYWEQA